MLILRIPILAALLLAAIGLPVSASPREVCTEIVRHLGYPVDDYRFEEAGLFSMERHHFGSLTCYINVSDEFDSLYQGKVPIAEDGYFGAEALAQRDRLKAEFDRGVELAAELRDAKIDAAREEYSQQHEHLAQERDAALAALRDSSGLVPAEQEADTNPNSIKPERVDPAQEPPGESAGEGGALKRPASDDGEAASEARRMYVVSDRMNRHTCPSTDCGVVGTFLYRQAVEVIEEREGWARITKRYDASCVNGISEYVDSGNNHCDSVNGIVDGMFAEWVSAEYLDSERPPDSAETAAANEQLVAKSDDFRAYRREFVRAAQTLIEQGRCSKSDFEEWGGWISSPSKGSGVYFMYCGGSHIDNRLYLDVRTGAIFR